MTFNCELEAYIVNLEGAASALWNFAHSDELSIEVETGLKWLAREIDSGVDDLRNCWNDRAKDNQPAKEQAPTTSA